MSRWDERGPRRRPGLPARRNPPVEVTEGRRGYDAFAASRAYKQHKAGVMVGTGVGVVLLVVTSAPWWLALALGFAAYGAVSGAGWFTGKPRREWTELPRTGQVPSIDEAKIAKGRTAVADAVLSDARKELHRLLDAGRSVRDVEVRGGVGRLGRTAGEVMSEIELDPTRLSRAQRMLTYYLPRAGDLAEGFALLERQREPDRQRIDQTRDMIVRLEAAFVHFADEMRAEEVSELDVDLRLLEQALRQDIGPAATPVKDAPARVPVRED